MSDSHPTLPERVSKSALVDTLTKLGIGLILLLAGVAFEASRSQGVMLKNLSDATITIDTKITEAVIPQMRENKSGLVDLRGELYRLAADRFTSQHGAQLKVDLMTEIKDLELRLRERDTKMEALQKRVNALEVKP